MNETKIINLELNSNSIFQIEATSTSTKTDKFVGGEEKKYKLDDTKKIIQDQIGEFSNIILNSMTEIKPDKLTVAFGFDISVGNNDAISVLLVKASSSANIKVQMEWSKNNA